MLDHILQGIVDEPQDENRWLVLADWLEEHDDPRRAELLRLHRRLLATCCEPEKHPERAVWHARIVALLADGVKPCVPQRTVLLGESVEMAFNFIPPGSFLMGSPPQEKGRVNNEVLHRVMLTRGFWMGVYPVTQAQWRAVMAKNRAAKKDAAAEAPPLPQERKEALAKVYVKIPKKYASEKTTPLTYTVEPGRQVKDFNLTD